MGNCCQIQSVNPRAIGNPNYSPQQEKIFSSSSALKFEIRTWHNSYPNLKNIVRTSRKQFISRQEGRIIFSQSKNNIIQVSSRTSQNIVLQKQYNHKINQSSVFEIQVKKTPQGFEINFLKDSGYELLTNERKIKVGQKFFTKGLQYQIIKFVNASKNLEKNLDDAETTHQYSDSNLTINHSMCSQQDAQNRNIQKFKPMCRICLSSGALPQNPLMSPCDCTGSVQYCHLKCWKQWIFGSQESDENLWAGKLKRLECELCKKNILKDKKYKENMIALLTQGANLKAPFVVLEALKPQSKSVYKNRQSSDFNYAIVSFAKNNKIVVDIDDQTEKTTNKESSKSEKNTCLELIDDTILIHDPDSKRGTYLKVDSPLMITTNVPRTFLFKKHLISLMIQ